MRRTRIRSLAIVLAAAAFLASLAALAAVAAVAVPGRAAAGGPTAPSGGGSSLYCVGVLYKVQAGHEAEAEGYLRDLQEKTRKEPGNVMFIVHRSTDDPRQFLIYEQYRSKAAFDTHCAQDYFKRDSPEGIRKIAERTGGTFTPL